MDQNEPLIVGFAETPYTVASGRSVFDLAGDVHAQLLESAALDNGAIDGLVACASTTEATNPFWSVYLSDALCLLYTSPSPRDGLLSRMPSSA